MMLQNTSKYVEYLKLVISPKYKEYNGLPWMGVEVSTCQFVYVYAILGYL